MNALMVAALLGAVVGVAVATGWVVLFTVAYVLAGLLLVSFAWSRVALGWLDVRHDVRSDRIRVGETLLERFELRSRSLVPRPWIALSDDARLPGRAAGQVVSLGPREARAWTLPTRCRYRGEYQLGPFVLRSSDPFGLFAARKTTTTHHRVLVLPATHRLLDFSVASRDLPGGDRAPVSGAHSAAQAASVRDYVPGDPFGRIHWKSTARSGRLIVKEMEHEPTADVWIALDLAAAPQRGTGLESTEEYGVTAAASVAQHFLEAGRTVGLAMHGDRHTLIQPDRGERQLIRILEALAVVQAHGEVPFAELLQSDAMRPDRNAALIAITPSLDPAWPEALRAAARRGARTVAVLVEPSTFGGRDSSIHLIGQLAAAGLATYLVKRGNPVPTR